jgi:hypothetical protein
MTALDRIRLIGLLRKSPANAGLFYVPLHQAGVPHARFRDEVLGCELFSSILAARVIAYFWRDTFNRYHPHSSLGMLAPAVFAERWRADHTEGVAMS